MKNFNDLCTSLEKAGIPIPEEKKRIFVEKLENSINYTPKVAFLGKTGSGKSSLCNSIFGVESFKVDDIKACTRFPQEELLKISDKSTKGIILMDAPGVGESEDRDQEYKELYKSLLPNIDIILWVLKADDRVYSPDQHFLNTCIKPNFDNNQQLLFVLNQVDNINPKQDWDSKDRKPGLNQINNIEEKITAVANFFEVPESKVIPVSATEKYNLIKLVDETIHALPNNKKITVAKKMDTKVLSPTAKKESSEGFIDFIVDNAFEIFHIPKEWKKTAKSVLKKVANLKIWPWNW